MEHDRLDEFTTLVVGASRSITKLKGNYMSNYNLGSTHTMCIRRLSVSSNGLTRTQLAECCELDKAQVSRIVTELLEKEYVYESTEKSNYKKRVILTDKGKKIVREIDRIILDINKFVSESIPDKEIEIFYKVFREICFNLKTAEQYAASTRKEANHG